MLEKLEAFCTLLRQNHVRVSVSEHVDAVTAVQTIGLEDPNALRAALAATLVKKQGDRAAFDELFSLYFMRGSELARGLTGAPLGALLEKMGLGDEDIERVLAVLADRAHELGAVARTALGMRQADLVTLLRMTGVSMDGMRIVSPLHIGYHTHRMLTALGVQDAERQVDQIMRTLGAALGEEQARQLRAMIQANLTTLRSAIRKHVQDEFERQNRELMEDLRLRTIAEKPFASLREDEIRRLRVEVARLARKLREQASLRPKVLRRGRLDVRRTIRRSLATGGVPFDLRRRHRRKEKPRLLILCDISDSVRHVSRFMLELVYMIQELFHGGRVRAFVFVSDVGEVTPLFATHEIDRAVELAYGGAVISVHSNSNYGRAFELFATRHLDAVTGKTSVIVIGDARNNYNPPNADRLAEIRRRAKRLIWLNPELPGAWGFGDSAMREYEPHCDRVVVAYSLESLRKVIDELVL